MPDSPEQELERWIGAFRGPLIGLLASWGPDWRTAEELAQDTFAEAWIARERFRGDPADLAAVGAWLRGIAFHLHAAARRREQRGAQRVLEHEQAAPAEADDERRAALVAAFSRLSDPHQTVLRMHYLEEASAREAGALLGITPKAVEDRLYQARKALRALVAETVPRGAEEVRS